MNKKPIRLIELFAGIGTQYQALKRIGTDVESYFISDWNIPSNIAYRAMLKAVNDIPEEIDYTVGLTRAEVEDKLIALGLSLDGKTPLPQKTLKRKNEKWQRDILNSFYYTHNHGSITNIHAEDLKITEKDKYDYYMTYSFPCLIEDTLVLTDKGYKKISNIRIGEKVLSHDNKYHEVIASEYTGMHKIISLKGMCFDKLECTYNHKFYTRKLVRKYPYKNGKRCSIRTFSEPYWDSAENLTKTNYLGVAINKNSIIPNWDGAIFEWKDGRKSRTSNKIKPLLTNIDFWWIIGRYIGDGWKRYNDTGIIICCNKDKIKNETEEITSHLDSINFNYAISEEDTTNKIHIPFKEIANFVSLFGNKADGKYIPDFMFDMPINLLKSFIDGYISADGCFTQGKYKVSSISKNLIYGIAQLVAKVYKVPYSIYYIQKDKICYIKGRKCNQKNYWQLVWKTKKCKQDKAFYENGYIWFPISDINKTNELKKVYDIEVKDSHSFTANSCIVHNCQDLSLAGKQAGMKKGSGTRSGLLWEVERLLQESTDKGLELPDVLLMENVPQVCSGKNKEDFEDWKNFLSSLGYKNFVKILDAADFEVPQSRKRCFMVSILKDVSYEFPEAIPLTRCVDDILETDVDEKYYINTPKAKELIQSLIDRGELSDRNVFCADGDINNSKIKDISNCIARQDRRISNYASEGKVIVEKKPIQLGNIMEENGFKNPQCGRVYDKNACSPTLNTCNGGNHEPKIIVDDIYNSREARIYKKYSLALRANRQGLKTIVAMRGRPVCNPNLRIAGLPTKQRLEINKEGISNTLTTVQKDNLVLENIIYDDYNNNIPDEQSRIGTITPTCGNSALRNGKKIIERVGQINSDNSQCGIVVSDESLFSTISAGCHGYANSHIYTQYRIRKLTPKECGRLMGVDDTVIYSMSKALSNSKLYQCFGNAIVVDVLCAIFSQLEIIREK